MKTMKFSAEKLLIGSKDYVMIVVGLAFYALGYSLFILPEKVVTGGVVGLASLGRFAFGWDVAITNYSINILMLLIAFRSVGKTFVFRTLFGATLTSMFIGLLGPWSYKPLVEQATFMNIIIGATLCGMGLGITFSHNGSSGGTDIIAAMVTKHTNVSFGRMMLYCDVLIISSSYFVFHGIDKIVYGLIFMMIYSVVADLVINRNRQAVQFMIISRNWEEIADAVTREAHRGCTILQGKGWFTKADTSVLMVISRKWESVQIFRIIKSIDPNAFISMANVTSVYGEGFDKMKVRVKKGKHPDKAAEAEPAAVAEAAPATVAAAENDKGDEAD